MTWKGELEKLSNSEKLSNFIKKKTKYDCLMNSKGGGLSYLLSGINWLKVIQARRCSAKLPSKPCVN